MKSSKIAASLIALASLAAGAAFAAEGKAALQFSEAGNPFPPTTSQLTRVQVKADFEAARTAGQLAAFSEASPSVAGAASDRTRAQVREEYREAARNGTLPTFGER